MWRNMLVLLVGLTNIFRYQFSYSFIGILLSIFITTYSASSSAAQSSDSISAQQIIKKTIVPASLIGAGIIINNTTFEKNIQSNIQNSVGSDFNFAADDYILYAPIAEMYIADIIGIKSRNHWFEQTKYLLISNIISSGITYIIKTSVIKERPNEISHNSLPSGHTTIAFTNATVLYNEFNQNAPLLAYSGYAFATTTGVFRVINNEHWISDVLIGAGIGILATQVVYFFEPLKRFNPFKKSEGIILLPQIDRQGYGFYFSYKI